jgi:hypothetical protein
MIGCHHTSLLLLLPVLVAAYEIKPETLPIINLNANQQTIRVVQE